jgi:hypothetical protein
VDDIIVRTCHMESQVELLVIQIEEAKIELPFLPPMLQARTLQNIIQWQSAISDVERTIARAKKALVMMIASNKDVARA